MFFSQKAKPEAGAQKHIAATLSELFALDTADTQDWVSNTGKELLVTLPFVMATQLSWLQDALEGALHDAKFNGFSLRITQKVKAAVTPSDAKVPKVKNIRNIIAVASGKGGVGKSATSVNLALALMQEGAKVGILDADIYGPSVPIMLGNAGERPVSHDNKHMQPLAAHGIVANSIGYLVSSEDAAIWRGPMASRALNQILHETDWPVLDYLIVDMPPGTGDIQLTMSQQVPLSAAVIVTTPQDLALADAQKGIAMFNKVDVPILGLIENMSFYQCSECGHKDYIFSQHGGQKLSERYQLPLLGALPLTAEIRESADGGIPLAISQPESALADTYREIARDVSMALALNVPSSEEGDKHIKGDPIAFNPV